MLKEVTNFFTMVRLPYSLVGFRGFSSKDRKVGRWGDWEKLLVPLTICETQIKSCYLWLKALMLFDCICCKFPLKYEKSGTKLKSWDLKDQINFRRFHMKVLMHKSLQIGHFLPQLLFTQKWKEHPVRQPQIAASNCIYSRYEVNYRIPERAEVNIKHSQ